MRTKGETASFTEGANQPARQPHSRIVHKKRRLVIRVHRPDRPNYSIPGELAIVEKARESGWYLLDLRFTNGDIAGGYNKCYAQYSKDGGSTWIELQQWSVTYFPTDFFTYSISQADLSDNFLFRFYMTPNSPGKHVYLDNMVITAKPDIPPAGTVVVIK